MTVYETAGASVDIPKREVFRYLGYRGIAPDETILGRVEEAVQKLQKESRPHSAWNVFPLELSTSSPDDIQIGSLRFFSRQLSRNLRGCSRVVLMAATIGPGADFLIRRSEAVSMLDAAIFQAAGAAMAESWCDEVNQRIIAAMKEQRLFPRPRFSPGYGDVPLDLQKDFSALLQMPQTCGISLTDTLLMVPSKSVTAFIGFSEHKEPCILAGCETCSHAADCAFHR